MDTNTRSFRTRGILPVSISRVFSCVAKGKWPNTSNVSQPFITGRQGFGFEVIPEEVAVTHGEGGVQLDSQRQADTAVLSWRVGRAASTSWTSGLSLSARSSDIDLKEFLVHRGMYVRELQCSVGGYTTAEYCTLLFPL